MKCAYRLADEASGFLRVNVVSPRVDFSRNAAVYDDRHGSLLPAETAQGLAAAAGLEPGDYVLDIGAGTGRVAVSLAALGCDVIGLEPASAMTEALRRKAAGTSVRVVAGEGAQLPFSASRFDIVVLARVLYLTADWRAVLQEAYRVLKPAPGVSYTSGPTERITRNGYRFGRRHGCSSSKPVSNRPFTRALGPRLK